MLVKMFIFLLAVAPVVSVAQKIEVRNDVSSIEGEQESGFQVNLHASREVSQTSLSRFLKTLGKTRNSGDYVTVTDPVISGKRIVGVLYGIATGDAQSTTVWIGIPGEDNQPDVQRDLEKLVYDFAVAFHREQIQLQIDESLRALQAVEKKQMRLVNQQTDFNNKIDNNKEEKISLEKALVENRIELEDLTNKLTANARAQDSVAEAAVQIRKVVEMHRERQRKVQ